MKERTQEVYDTPTMSVRVRKRQQPSLINFCDQKAEENRQESSNIAKKKHF
jgi:hypothetical protein